MVVWLSSFSGSAKASTTRFTDEVPSPRSISQWLSVSNVVMFGAVAQVHSSVPHSQAPYTYTWVAADALPDPAASADSMASTTAASAALP